ncbi:hypothetical protein ALP29_04530 [Pseudomonas syringae pv. avii]|uniref:Uncharacterized protein n=1 Tax=Pseudomonas syringae pv. avii TaxID=663959 RepID=A0A3M5VKL0_PSESX|nr:hypothetical protein ALP43_02485 [Pseudomonas azotoformans]RMU58759.1 hypothetical protein ALP29_04530 [Pseudomonas syringae pv. avii]
MVMDLLMPTVEMAVDSFFHEVIDAFVFASSLPCEVSM